MISQSFEPSRGRVAKVLVQKLLRAVEAEKQGLKNRVLAPSGGALALLSQGCPRQRGHYASRCDKGVKRLRPESDDKNSEAMWLRKRRRAVQQEAATTPALGVTDSQLPDGAWQPSHEKCRQKQLDKMRKQETRAFRDNLLLPHEVSDELITRGSKAQKLDKAADRRRVCSKQRVAAQIQSSQAKPCPWDALINKPAFIEADIEGVASIRLALQAKGLVTVEMWQDAEVLPSMSMERGEYSADSRRRKEPESGVVLFNARMS